MKTSKHIVFSLLAWLVLPWCAQAQSDSSTYNESVIITGSFNPIIERSEKINVAPAITDTSSDLEHRFSYNLESYRLSSVFEPSQFKPVRIVAEPRTKLYHNYFRIGLGNYWSPLADIYFNSTASKKFNYGIRLNHRSSWGTIGSDDEPENYFGPNHFSLTDVALFGRYIANDNLQLFTDLAYQNDYNLYYGFSDSTLLSHGMKRADLQTADYKAAYNRFAWNVGAKSASATTRWPYEVRLHISDLAASYGQNEFNFALDGQIGFRNKGFLGALRMALDGYSQNVNDSIYPLGHVSAYDAAWMPDTDYIAHAARSIFKVNPYVEFSLAALRIHAGAIVAFDGYADNAKSVTKFFPDVTINCNLANNALGLSFGAKGDATPITWNAIRQINPYVMPGSQVNSYYANDFFAKVRYNFSKKLELNLNVSYTLFDNLLSFRPNDDDYLLGNVFRPKYESGNLLTVGGDFSFVNDELIRISVGGNYYHRTAADNDSLPILYAFPYDIHLKADVNYNDKLLLYLKFMVMGAVDADYAYDNTAHEYIVSETLPARFGLNLGGEYRFSKLFSVFAQIDNLLFQRYYYWRNYPSQRALFTVGATFTIPSK